MRIISRRRLRDFCKGRTGDAEIAEKSLSAWYKLTRDAVWAHFAALKQTFGSADSVGNCVVFDVGNNRFRLIGRINYARGIVYILRVMDHEEYDKIRWVDDCGCRKPAPKRPASPKTPHKAAPARRPRRER